MGSIFFKDRNRISLLLMSLFVFFDLFSQETSIAPYSKTIPVIYIDTKGVPVITKEDQVSATVYVETFETGGGQNLGNVDNQISCKIKCRGNYTFKAYDKKSYKIKFQEKQKLLGMNANKHFVLLAHPDDNGFLKNTVRFEVSRLVGMEFTPEQRPVEIMLNGEYMGLYFLTEHVRPGKNRVQIDVQNDKESYTDYIKSGGWLVEIDNYQRDNQVEIDVSDVDIPNLWITCHSPEEMSEEQKICLLDEFTQIKEAIYNDNKESIEWENYIDIDELARYCIVTEVTMHLESYFGSTFIYKKNGGSKWKFGPVWDSSCSLYSTQIYNYTWNPQTNKYGYNIMTEISKYPRFISAVKKLWPNFYFKSNSLYPAIDAFAEQIADAAKFNFARWPQYKSEDIIGIKESVKEILTRRIEWLNSQWGEKTDINQFEKANKANNIENCWYNLSGMKMEAPPHDILPKGLYIRSIDGKKVKFVIR